MPNTVTPSMPLKTAMPSVRRISAPAPVREQERHDAQDEGHRGHDDRPQPQPARLERRLPDRHCPSRRITLANSTIRIAFLLARPTSTTRPIWVKMLMSMLAIHTPVDRAQEAQRHRQDHRQRHRPALELRRQHQEDHDDRERRRRSWPCCRPGARGRPARSIRRPSTSAATRAASWSITSIACPELIPGGRCR